jgi:hypothetical protein
MVATGPTLRRAETNEPDAPVMCLRCARQAEFAGRARAPVCAMSRATSGKFGPVGTGHATILALEWLDTLGPCHRNAA